MNEELLEALARIEGLDEDDDIKMPKVRFSFEDLEDDDGEDWDLDDEDEDDED